MVTLYTHEHKDIISSIKHESKKIIDLSKKVKKNGYIKNGKKLKCKFIEFYNVAEELRKHIVSSKYNTTSDYEKNSMIEFSYYLIKNRVLSQKTYLFIKDYIELRNKLVHNMKSVTKKDLVKFILQNKRNFYNLADELEENIDTILLIFVNKD